MNIIASHLSQTVFSFKPPLEKKSVRGWMHLLPSLFAFRYISKGLAKMSGFEELQRRQFSMIELGF